MLAERCAQLAVELLNVIEATTHRRRSHAESVEPLVAALDSQACPGRLVSSRRVAATDRQLASLTGCVDDRGV